MKLMQRLLGHFLERTDLGVEEDVGLLVERLADGEQLPDFGQWIRFLEERAMTLVPDALEDFFGRSPKANHQGVLLEAGKIGIVGRQTATGGDDGPLARRQFRDKFAFIFAETVFAILGENDGN